MRALWSDRPNCSHNVSQKVKRIRRVSDSKGGGRIEEGGRIKFLPRGASKLRQRRDICTAGRTS